MNLETPTMLTIKETAAKTGLAEYRIRQLCLEKKIIYIQCGKKYLVNYEKLIDYLNTGNTYPEPAANTIRPINLSS